MNRTLTQTDPSAPVASLWLRLGAKLIDHGLWSFIEVGCIGLGAYINAIGGPAWAIAAGPVISLVLWYLYVYRLTLTRGQTLGKMAAGIRVVGTDGTLAGRPAILRRVLVEALFDLAGGLCMALAWVAGIAVSPAKAPGFAAAGLALGSLVGLVDPAWILLNPGRRALHDLAAGTCVLRVRETRSVVWAAAAACLAAWIVLPFCVMRPLFVESYVVPSGSMEPTIQVGDRILANKLMMRLRGPRPGEIIMFTAPTWVDPERKMFVKRVVGVADDALAVRDGKLFRNDAPVQEPYIAEPMGYTWPTRSRDGHSVVVPDGSVVVMGDNRNDSNDSHRWERMSADGTRYEPAPFLPVGNVKGRLIFRFWPPDRMGTVAQEEYAE